MHSIPSTVTTLFLGSFAAVALSSSAFSGEVVRVADRCAIYGSGFVELGNGTCGQIGRGRIGDASGDRWGAGSASNAGLRSDGVGMLPGAGGARHLRIQADPDFR